MPHDFKRLLGSQGTGSPHLGEFRSVLLGEKTPRARGGRGSWEPLPVSQLSAGFPEGMGEEERGLRRWPEAGPPGSPPSEAEGWSRLQSSSVWLVQPLDFYIHFWNGRVYK